MVMTFISAAQITITDNDMPIVNDIYKINITSDLQGNDPALTGTNYLWDYSQLTTETQRADTLVVVSSLPIIFQYFFNNSFMFPNHKADYGVKGQNMNIQTVAITDVYNFYKKSPTQYANVGFAANINNIPTPTRRTPVDVEYVFPLNYNDNNISNSEFLISIPTYGDYGQSQERIDTVDGWGSIITPAGTTECLRIKSILNIVDTVYIASLNIGFSIPRPQQIEYKWLAKKTGVPFLKITSNLGTYQVEHQDSLRYVKPETPFKFKLFPNPANELITLEFHTSTSRNVDIIFYDINGKKAKNAYSGKSVKGNNTITLPFSELKLSKGIYFVNVLIEGMMDKTEKMIIIE